jgi:uncharacterized protein YerC
VLEHAKREHVYEYISGTQTVSEYQSKQSIYSLTQMLKEESAYAEVVLKRMNSNPLYALTVQLVRQWPAREVPIH